MKFKTVIAILATISLAQTVQANANGNGTLRRIVAQNEQPAYGAVETQVIVTQQPAQVVEATPVQQQPATVVEAAPVLESKAEAMRKARQNAEIQTEQMIVEKLEEARLREEQERAQRLFGNKFESPAQQQPQQQVVTPAPVQTVVVPEEKPAPAQVTIEKVEIVQPQPAPVVAEEEAPKSKLSAKSLIDEEEEESFSQRWYISGTLGGLNYDASNVKTNMGGGFAIGVLVNERTAVEGSFIYSNHYIDTFWNPGIYRELDQYDIGLNAKYYILTQRVRPYIGAGMSYISRQYHSRLVPNSIIFNTAAPSSEETEAINLNLMAGADFIVSDTISIGAGIDYSTNVMNRNEFDFSNYYTTLPENTKALEEIDFYMLKVTAKMTF